MLFGREDELSELLAWVRGPQRLFTVRGPPGIGKTTLARHLTQRLGKAGLPWAWVEVDASCERTVLLERLAAAVQTPMKASDAGLTLTRLAETLDAGHLVLVLDGADQSPDGRRLVDDLLALTERLTIVCCCWSSLGLPTERVMLVRPFSLEEGAELLHRRLERLAPHRRLLRKEAETLSTSTAGLPLALELVAARIAALGTAPVLAEVTEHGLSSSALDRSIDAAFSHLEEPARSALASLSVFRGRFDASAALAVIGAGATLEVLERLAAASLLHVDDDVPPRYRLLDSVRDFVARRVPHVLEGARERHARHFSVPSPPRRDEAGAWGPLGALRDDLFDAWSWASERGSPLAVALANTLDPLLIIQGNAAVHRRVLERTLALTGADQPARIDLLLALARVDSIRGRNRASLAPIDEALTLARAHGDTSRLAWSSAFRCFAARPLGQFDEALEHGARALGLAVEVRDHRLIAMAEQALGRVASSQGRLAEAIAAQRRAGAAARVAKAPRLLGITRSNLGEALQAAGQFDAAAEALREGREAFEAVGDHFHLARLAVHEVGLQVAAHRGSDPRVMQRALDGVIDMEDLEGELEARRWMVLAASAAGSSELARRRLEDLVAAARLTDDVTFLERLRELEGALELRAVLGPPPTVARLSRDGRQLELGALRLDLSRRGPLRRILFALVEERIERPGRAVSASAVQEAGWPGEKILADSAAARVYMAIRRLRELGLEPVLLTSAEGYRLSEHADVAWLD